MSKIQYIALRIAVIVVLCSTVSIATSEGGWYWALPIAVILAASTIYYTIFRGNKVNEVIVDERTYLVQEKAAAMAIRIFFPAVMVIGAILVVLSYKAGFDFSQVGIILIYTVFALALLVIILRFHYDRKL